VSPGFPGARRQQVVASSSQWVQPTGASRRLPFEVHPTTDVDLADWAGRHADIVDAWLHVYGAVLFTGFGTGIDEFARVATTLAGTAMPYRERSSPRTELVPGVFTSTDYPADQPIPLHNENSYQRGFPARLVFCCLEPAERGGATPLADCRRVLARIDPAVMATFRGKGVRYVRNYSVGPGMTWQEAFQETSRERVEDYCRDQGIRAQWRSDGGLRTEQVRPAVAVHPQTGEQVWFNHAAFFHVSALDPAVRAALLDQFGERGLPVHTYYGDGTPIEPAALVDIRAAYAAETVAVPWRRGDVLLVDNLLAAHGREPFVGRRRVVVSMAGALSHDDLPGGLET
jgi:alpha-ketoglutarate-dependent taurine dioxygenase